MISMRKWRGALAVLGAAFSVSLLSLPASAGAAFQYPDLRPLPAEDIHLGTKLFNGEHHYIVRFSSYMSNAGQGAMELHGRPKLLLPDGTFDVDQFVYDDGNAAPEVNQIGTFYFHRAPGHDHFHFEDFARYELWTQRGYDRAAANGFTSGQPLVKSKKISFCVQDSSQVGESPALVPVYRTLPCSPLMQGISVGWADLYDWTLDDQWLDVGQHPLPDGTYVVRIIGDPSNKIYESSNKADPTRESEVANTSARYITIVNGGLGTTP